ncbi:MULTISPECIES: HDOD domain-containing protein [Chromobacterium]|uniref:HDOD domain-containing protein n=1 Tax=Chromobacterium haemolyticum TaxID=394935 RepID=A0A1W0CIR2_9NEIS|nr:MULTISPECIES: HDOD domain-containing protein [Chromobacterium]OQS34673.1 HDOD domain-containing protein [Chromobacterium haemolyticum]QOZ82047.1 HDOD domain-containing protein [Chromobacterium sp. Rain0013]WON82051.1 HDOD domain-containing protein [Chromobacterium haemolyticum]
MQVAEIFEKASGKLPMVPKVVQELVASFHRTDVNIDEITDKVGHDQVLTARVLRLANTARFGGSRRVGSLDDAIILLGFDNLRVLVIASGVTGATLGIQGFDMKAFWQRSFAMANAAKRLARLAKLDPQLGYTCGLLSNIGELVLYVAVPEQALQIDRIVAGGADRVATERMLLGMDLTEVGAELARRWNFPDEIQEAIFNQHDLLNEEVSPFALLIGLASFMTSGFNHDMSEEDMLATLPVSVMERAGLHREALAEALPELREACTALDEMF